MKGFLKLKAIDFDTWNNAATIEANENGLSCDAYTICRPDTDPLYCWARVEHDFIEGDILSDEEAIEQGML